MKSGQASFTARFPAIMRAAHQILDAAPPILDDPLAVGFIDEAGTDAIKEQGARYQSPPLRQVRAWFVARQRFAEDLLGEAWAEGIRQYVILGAGLDTFAYRQPEALTGLSIFEVDHPATQAWKKARLAELGIAIPQNITYVALDFETQTLVDGLAQHGFNALEPTFFSWLGVTMYLERTAVLHTLQDVAGLPQRSEIIFDFEVEDAQLDDQVRHSLAKATARTAQQGEPWKSRFDAEALRTDILALGFSSARHFDHGMIDQLYLAERTDGLSLRGVGHIMTAIV